MLIYQGLTPDSIGSRTAIVGLVLIGAAILIVIGIVIVATVTAIESGWERLDQWRRQHRNIWLGWILFTVGIALLALAFIFYNIGLGVAGAFVLFFLWRMNENSTI